MVIFLRYFIHVCMHTVFPGVFARIFYKDKWGKVWLVFLMTMFIDLDHLLSTPIFDPGRCSIGHHPLHSYLAVSLYIIGLFFQKTRIISFGLLLHILTDLQDCLWIK